MMNCDLSEIVTESVMKNASQPALEHRDSKESDPVVISIDPARRDTACALEELAHTSDELTGLSGSEVLHTSDGFHAVVSGIHRVAAAARACAAAGLRREDMDPKLTKLRDECAKSPFTRHIMQWPRGYPGDFAIVDYICAQENRAPPGTIAYWIEEYSLGTTMAQQHRNKVQRQASEIVSCAEAAFNRNSEAVIAVLACGSSPDLVQVQHLVSSFNAKFVLSDSDTEALKVSLNRLPSLAGRVETISGNVVRSLKKLARRAPYDLVLAGGLFDYIPDPIAELLVRNVIGMLRPGGRFFFTNIAPNSPYEDWIALVCNWSLISRDEADLRTLVARASGHSLEVRAERDLTRLAVLVTVFSAH